MFTGIVQAQGAVRALRASAADRDLTVTCPSDVTDRLSIGDSIALDGVCQTVTRLADGEFDVHAIAETLRVTTLGEVAVGDPLNLETALGAGDPLGGHFVQGHVDGTATITAIEPLGDAITYRFEAAAELVRQLVPKGSVALHGVSLTVGPEVGETTFEVYLIPHTVEVTTLKYRRVGDRVNLETDVLGKYILRYLGQLGADVRGGITWDKLQRAGWEPGPNQGGHA